MRRVAATIVVILLALVFIHERLSSKLLAAI
jgi:hypothetical protein